MLRSNRFYVQDYLRVEVEAEVQVQVLTRLTTRPMVPTQRISLGSWMVSGS